MPEMNRPLKVFLYHVPVDKEVVRDLYLRLIKDGVDARLVKEKILPGQDWKHEIYQAVREADVVFACLSGRSTEGESRRKEVQAAFDDAIEQWKDELFVIPVYLEECERPENLEKWHGVDLFAELGYDMLMYALQGRADQVGASIQRKESSLPEISTSSAKSEESAPEERAAETLQELPEVLVEGPGILIEGATVDLQGSVVQRKPGRVRMLTLAGISLAGIIVMAFLDPPWLERWYQLALTFDLGQVTGSSTAKVSKPIYRTPNANIVFLIDTSSSMHGQQIKSVKSYVSDFISDLDEEYLISIMS
ncbi:MAG TPA: TIR domain-containing protein, partial [Anaerolineales bacterium]|nr:TIR domain-containing protein [Anaerolineales bacterium]